MRREVASLILKIIPEIESIFNRGIWNQIYHFLHHHKFNQNNYDYNIYM